jgi:hypothetical protein
MTVSTMTNARKFDGLLGDNDEEGTMMGNDN